MKKLIAIAVVFALFAGVAAFADDGVVKEGITISGAAEARFVPFRITGHGYTGNGGISGYTPFGSWKDGKYDPGKTEDDGRGELYTGVFAYKVQVNVKGVSDYAGFELNFKVDRDGGRRISGSDDVLGPASGGVGFLGNNTFIVRDGANFWVQPFGKPVLRVTYGGGGNAGLSGSNGEAFGSMGISEYTVKHDYRNAGGNGNIFSGFNGDGIVIDSVGLVENLKFGIALPNIANGEPTFANAWTNVQIAAGYQIPDVGLVRLGYFGGRAETIDFNSLTDYQYRYIYNGKVPFAGDVELESAVALIPGTPAIPGVPGGTPGTPGTPETPKSDAVILRGIASIIKATPGTGQDFSNYIPYSNAFFQAAFKLSTPAVPGLTADLGARFFFNQSAKFSYDDTGNATPPNTTKYEGSRENVGGLNIGLGVKYALPDTDFSVGLAFHATQIGRKSTFSQKITTGGGTPVETKEVREEPVKMTLLIAPVYVLDGTTFGLDLGFYFTGETRVKTGDKDPELKKDSEARYGFGAYVKRAFGKATLQAGVAVQSPLLWTAPGAKGNPPNTAPIPQGGTYNIYVPLSFSVGF